MFKFSSSYPTLLWNFWKRFQLEYVSLLQNKTKWSGSTGDLLVGALVLIKEKGQLPLVWPLGRVIKVFPGTDGVTRVVELKTKRRTVVRAFNIVCPLPLSSILQPGENVRAPQTARPSSATIVRHRKTASGGGARLVEDRHFTTELRRQRARTRSYLPIVNVVTQVSLYLT